MFSKLPSTGVATQVCTILLPFLCLAMVVDFALGVPDDMLEEEVDSPRDQDSVHLTRRGMSRSKTVCRIAVRITVMAATFPILLWTVFMGYKLINGSSHGKDETVALVAAIITMAFGISLLLNGISIAKDLAQELSTHMQQAELGTDTHNKQQLACLKA